MRMRWVVGDITSLLNLPVVEISEPVHTFRLVYERSPVSYNDQTIPTGQKVLIRGDTGAILSNVGQDRHTVQNKDAFNFFTWYVLAGDMDMHTAGSLKGGRLSGLSRRSKNPLTSLAGIRWMRICCFPIRISTENR